jgi:hypothetical protein
MQQPLIGLGYRPVRRIDHGPVPVTRREPHLERPEISHPSPTSPAVNERRLYVLAKINSVNDTPAKRVAHGYLRAVLRQCPTPLDPGRNDLFHARVPLDFVRLVFAVIADTPQHTYQVLTKRSARLPKIAAKLDWPPNLWVGVSIEHSDGLFRADHLRTVPAAVRFLSLEPLLGPLPGLDLTGIDWVIVGGESGRGHRPVHPDWIRDLRERSVRQGVAFFFKQWGGRTPKRAAGN